MCSRVEPRKGAAQGIALCSDEFISNLLQEFPENKMNLITRVRILDNDTYTRQCRVVYKGKLDASLRHLWICKAEVPCVVTVAFSALLDLLR